MVVKPSFAMPQSNTQLQTQAATRAAKPKPAAGGTPRSDGRAGKLQMTVWLPREAKIAIDLWVAQHQKTVQWVGEEALDLFFAQQNMQRIARSGAPVDD
ncbi:MAG: hypothetical protein ACRYGR_08600 [Janthinobacterium lividum]